MHADCVPSAGCSGLLSTSDGGVFMAAASGNPVFVYVSKAVEEGDSTTGVEVLSALR